MDFLDLALIEPWIIFGPGESHVAIFLIGRTREDNRRKARIELSFFSLLTAIVGDIVLLS